jgi:hypothetical protein
MPTKMIPPTIAKMGSVKDNIKISLCVVLLLEGPVPSPHKNQFQNLLQLNSRYISHVFCKLWNIQLEW